MCIDTTKFSKITKEELAEIAKYIAKWDAEFISRRYLINKEMIIICA